MPNDLATIPILKIVVILYSRNPNFLHGTGLGKDYFTVVLNLCSELQLEDSADFASNYRGSSVRYRP